MTGDKSPLRSNPHRAPSPDFVNYSFEPDRIIKLGTLMTKRIGNPLCFMAAICITMAAQTDLFYRH